MLSGESLSTLLYAIATGYADRAKNLIYTSDELDDDERKRLLLVVEDDVDGSALQARRLGDALRELDADRDLVNECYRTSFYLSDDCVDLAANPLFTFFLAHRSGHLIDKWVHYFPIYDRHLTRYRGGDPRLLEIGVGRGGSLDMWERYLGPAATLVGIDIDEKAALLAGSQRTILIGDQADRDFLGAIVEQHGPFDIIIDDGGHTMEQQVTSIETLFPTLADGGVYMVEDTHTSYWEEFGGGRGREGTFIEWVKGRIDELHRYHLADAVDPVWTDHVDAIHCYDSVVVVDKRRRFAPFSEQMGAADFIYKRRPVTALVGEALATRDAALAQREAEATKRRRLSEELAVTQNDLLDAWDQVKALRHSASWRATAPLRAIIRRLRRNQ